MTPLSLLAGRTVGSNSTGGLLEPFNIHAGMFSIDSNVWKIKTNIDMIFVAKSS